MNLKSLQLIGDSFLKYAITTHLYCMYPNTWADKLSNLRLKYASNENLCYVAKQKEYIVATEFKSQINWLSFCQCIPKNLEQALTDLGVSTNHYNTVDLFRCIVMNKPEKGQSNHINSRFHDGNGNSTSSPGQNTSIEELPCFILYKLLTKHNIPYKRNADYIKSLIGAYLMSCGPSQALLFISWLGIYGTCKASDTNKTTEGKSMPWEQMKYGYLYSVPSPLIQNVPRSREQLSHLMNGFDSFEKKIGYTFHDQGYLLQAFTHLTYSPNRQTDCYERLEFLGDAVLDYLIMHNLYEELHLHSSDVLKQLHSVLVSNVLFASVAVKYSFHNYLRYISKHTEFLVDKFLTYQKWNPEKIINKLIYLERGCEGEYSNFPKPLADVFESVAGAIYLDSGRSLDAVWKVYSKLMKTEIDFMKTTGLKFLV